MTIEQKYKTKVSYRNYEDGFYKKVIDLRKDEEEYFIQTNTGWESVPNPKIGLQIRFEFPQ